MAMKRTIKRAAGVLLAGSMIITNGIRCLAAGNGTVCDEAMYVTMDAYGNITETSVVKSYDLHGARVVVDHGTYSRVNNMTDYGVPLTDGDQVTFTFDEAPKNDRFYFEGILDPEEVKEELPWDISVSYKLNGVEREIEELSHEKGLVEISVDAVPNKNAREYYRNNMSLEIVSLVDMDKNLSVEAPGAQIQSMGSMKAVLFMVFPGEEQHYTLRIGSDDFDFSGLMFLMTPITLSQLDRLEDLREARDTVKDSADAIGDSLDIILDSLEGMQSGLSGTVDGLKKLDESRKVIASTKDGIYVDADEALKVLKELSDRGVPFTSYVKEAQNALEDTNRELNRMNSSVQELDSHLEDLGYGLKHVNTDLNDVVDLLSDTRHDIGSYEKKLMDLRKDLEELEQKREAVNESVSELKKIIEGLKVLKQKIHDHEEVLGLTDEQSARLMEALENFIDGLPEESQEKAAILIASCSDAIGKILEDAASGDTGAAEQGISKLIRILETLVGTAGQPTKLDSMIESVTQSVSTLENIVYTVHRDGESLENVLGDTGDLADTLRRSAATGQDLLTELDSLTGIMNTYHETAVDSLADLGLLIDSAVRGANTMYVLMSDVESSLKTVGEPLNKGTQLTLNGLADALGKAIDGLSKTGVIRDAKNTVEDLADEKWEEYTGEDMTILNADVNAKKVSFTSDENPEPQSLQIILRTEGTSETEKEEAEPVNENFRAEGNFIQRLLSILKRIADAVKGIFKQA